MFDFLVLLNLMFVAYLLPIIDGIEQTTIVAFVVCLVVLVLVLAITFLCLSMPFVIRTNFTSEQQTC
jgi:hypothetical protein